MYIDFTSKQYFFILHALAVMITFYSNDFSSICNYWVGEGRTRLEVRWIEPTFVLPEGKREVPVATVRRVLGA